jgi:acyl dehydratase
VTIERYEDIGFGDELPEFHPDIAMPTVVRFTEAAGMRFGRFTDHEEARKSGLPGAIVPGIMSQGILAAMIHRWAPTATIEKIDTIFRAPLVVDSRPLGRGVVTDMDDETRIVEIDLTLTNEAGETRVLGTATVKI